MKSPMLATALALTSKYGISVIPIMPGGKQPLTGYKWRDFQNRIMTREEVERAFSNGCRIAVIGGKGSGNLELLDFDEIGIFEEWWDLLTENGYAEVLASLVIETSPSGGKHVFYRCEIIEGNRKLARRMATDAELAVHPSTKIRVRIETRGNGGYAVCAPSDGYTEVQGRLSAVPTISAEAREAFFSAAAMFDQMPESAPDSQERKERDPAGSKPGDDFNARASWADVLSGWTHVYTKGERDYWRRPGTKNKVSATTGNGPDDLLYVFSSSTDLTPERGYSKFGAYTLLNHGGNFHASAGDLAAKGFGQKALPQKEDEPRPPDDDPEITDEDFAPRKFHKTDQGNCERLVHRYGDQFRHCHAFEKFLVWDGIRWAEDRTGAAGIRRMAVETIYDLYREAKTLPDAERESLSKWANKSESRNGIVAMVDLAKKELPIPIEAEQLDTHPLLLNTLSGTIDLETGKLRPHSRADHLTKACLLEYDPDAKCPRFEKFIREVLPDTEEMRTYIQRVWGYCLSGDTRVDALFFCYGSGENGKSIFIETLKSMLFDYSLVIPIETLMIQKGDRLPVELADMRKMRIVCASETPEGRTIDSAKIKWLTGKDELTARRLYGHPFNFKPTHKLWMSGNHKPKITDDSHGMWRRVKLIPFENQFPEGSSQRDDQLGAKLQKEMPGILAWMVRGCMDFLKGGLKEPAEVSSAVNEYRDSMDILGTFLGDCCECDPFAEYSARSRALYTSYQTWARASGQKEMAEQTFSGKIAERGFVKKRGSAGMFFTGIRLKETPTEISLPYRDD